jgi:predicted ester cyclase
VDEMMTADCISHWPGEDFRGPEGFKEAVKRSRNAFPDLHITIEDVLAEGDKIATRWTLRGTQKGELRGIAPTNKQVTVPGIIVTREANGKTAEEWKSYDVMGMMQQLGVIPPMGRR